MGKFSGLLICSDFDGTLYCRDRMSDVTKDAIRYFKENGGIFTLATGRYPAVIQRKGLEGLFNAPIICMNGALLYDYERGEALYEGFFLRDCREAILDLCRDCAPVEHVFFFPQQPWDSIRLDKTQTEEIGLALRERLYKIVFIVDRERSDEAKEMIVERFGEGYTITRSNLPYVEIQESVSDKGKTARRLARMVGADQLICVGDFENDIPMIREADLGLAMGNGIDSLKREADRVLDPVEEDGVARFIYGL